MSEIQMTKGHEKLSRFTVVGKIQITLRNHYTYCQAFFFLNDTIAIASGYKG